MAAVEPLHGMSFALLHLACIQVIGRIVPPGLAATAQAIHGTVAIGAMTSVLTLASGSLYRHFGAAGLWAMAMLCILAFPFILWLRSVLDAGCTTSAAIGGVPNQRELVRSAPSAFREQPR
jgi:PPP family 3-phenylpropionic acid transporter